MKKGIILFICILTYSISVAQGEKTFTLLYTNDLHAHLDPQKIPWISNTRLVGGFANIATLVKKEKADNPNTVYFDAGDYFTGPYISSLTKGEAVIDVMNHLSIDAACIGNHEFDHDWKNVPKQLKKATFPILNGNIFIKDRKNKLLWDHPYKIITVNGIRIGVIGLHGRFAFYDTIADEMIQGVETRDEEFYLKKYIAALKGQTDLIVLLIHQGIPGRQSSSGAVDVARNLKRDIELAANVPGIDIIVTGHAHQGTKQPLESNGTLIVSTDALGLELGKLQLTYDPKTDKITKFTNQLDYIFDDAVEDDSATLATINKWKEKVRTITDEIICSIPTPLSRSYGDESPMGNMVADAMLYASPDAEIALTNSGGLRQDIDAGTVTVGNLISAFPFPNTLVYVELKGRSIKTLLEHGAGQTNGIMQVSKGVEMIYDESLPVGIRVLSCTINGKPLEDERTYKVVTSNFLADGGDGFVEFKNALSAKRTGIEIIQAMINYLRLSRIYTPQVFNRITHKKS